MSTRVLHVLGSMQRGGGIQALIMSVYRTMPTDIKFDFLLYNSYGQEADFEKEIISMGGSVYYIHSRGESASQNYKELKDFFRKKARDYGAVHSHVSSASYILPAKFAYNYGIPVRIIHSHNIGVKGARIGTELHVFLHKTHRRQIEKYCNVYLGCSDLASKWLYTKEILPKAEIIRNGIITEKYIFDINMRTRIRNQYSVKNDEVLIGNVARFHKQKNHDFLIDIFSYIHAHIPKTKLVLVGEGSEREKVEKKVKACSLENCVIFTGISNDVPGLMNAMDLFLFPSLYEGLGIVLIEAQCSGLKCFASADVIPDDVKVTNLLDFISLDDGADFWGDKIIDCIVSEPKVREDHISEVKLKGYDIRSTTDRLTEIYTGAFNI